MVKSNIATASGAAYTSRPADGGRSGCSGRTICQLCLSPDDDGQIEYLPLKEATGWRLIDGEAAAMLNARAVLHAPTAPSSGTVELTFAETGAQELAFYSYYFQKQEALQSAYRLELAVFIGDGYWPVGEAHLVENLGDGHRTMDQGYDPGDSRCADRWPHRR